MSDLTEALASLHPVKGSEGIGLLVVDWEPIVAAARRWADLEAQVADGGSVMAVWTVPCDHEAHERCVKRKVILGEGTE